MVPVVAVFRGFIPVPRANRGRRPTGSSELPASGGLVPVLGGKLPSRAAKSIGKRLTVRCHWREFRMPGSGKGCVRGLAAEGVCQGATRHLSGRLRLRYTRIASTSWDAT